MVIFCDEVPAAVMMIGRTDFGADDSELLQFVSRQHAALSIKNGVPFVENVGKNPILLRRADGRTIVVRSGVKKRLCNAGEVVQLQVDRKQTDLTLRIGVRTRGDRTHVKCTRDPLSGVQAIDAFFPATDLDDASGLSQEGQRIDDETNPLEDDDETEPPGDDDDDDETEGPGDDDETERDGDDEERDGGDEERVTKRPRVS